MGIGEGVPEYALHLDPAQRQCSSGKEGGKEARQPELQENGFRRYGDTSASCQEVGPGKQQEHCRKNRFRKVFPHR